MQQHDKNEKILVIKLGALGDFIQSLGAMAAVRKHHANAHITLMTTKPYKNFAEKSEYFDEIWIDKKPKLLDIKGWASMRSKLLNGQYSRIYDLQNNDRTSIYLKLLPKNKRPEWVGAAKGASHRNNSLERTAGTAFEGHKQTLSLAGIKDVKIDNMSWINENLSKFDLKEPFVLLVPGCSPQHPQKRWPAEYYAEVAQTLTTDGFQIVIIGTDAEKDITSFIASTCPQALDLTGKTTLFEIISIAQKAYAAIGNDTGPMHMIGPTGCKTIVLFSDHGDPKKHAPNGNDVHVLQKDDLKELTTGTVLNKFNELKNKQTNQSEQ